MKGLKLLTTLCVLTMGVTAFDVFEGIRQRERFEELRVAMQPPRTFPVVVSPVSRVIPPLIVMPDVQRGPLVEKDTELLVNRFCLDLGGCPSPVQLKVYSAPNMPRNVRAFTTRSDRDDNGPGCTLTFDAESAHALEIVAHEVCHCVNDHSVMNGVGFVETVSSTEIINREDGAKICAGRLTR